ncbi:MAG TPA: DUF3152 domain-containing protein [Beutenbergiaceae bacterium]|nr:DUF3152 domain-containing protein [Beutenbergiaceae bacterium]
MRPRSVAAYCAVLALFAGMVTATQLAPPPQPTPYPNAGADPAPVQEPALLSAASTDDPHLSSAPSPQESLLGLGPGAAEDDDAEEVAEAAGPGEDETAEYYYFAPHQPLPLDGEQVPPPAPEPTQAELDDAEAGVLGTDVEDGAGSLDVLPGSEEAPEPGAERVVEVQIEVEDGLPVDAEAFGDFVMETLNDDRGWAAVEPVSFARTDDSAEFRVVLGSPDLIDEMCAPLDTAGQYSCGRNGHAALNALRWVHGAESYLEAGGELQDYRRYLVNHEVGHLLWYQHQDCPADGEPAPIMVQQSMSLDGCEPTAWVEE